MTTTLKNPKLCWTGLAAILALTTFASSGGVQAATPMGAGAATDKAAQIAEARFQSHVRQGYLDIANYAAARTGNGQIAEYFRTKAESIQNRGLVDPENPEYLVTLNGVNIGEARAKLINSLTEEQIEQNPEIAAAALVNFDCFVREIDRKDETCLQNFALSLASLTQSNMPGMKETANPEPNKPSVPGDTEVPDRVTYDPPGMPTTPEAPTPPMPPKTPPHHNPDPEEPNPHDPYPGHPPSFPDGIGDGSGDGDGDDHYPTHIGLNDHRAGSDSFSRDPGTSFSDLGTETKDSGNKDRDDDDDDDSNSNN